MMPNVEEYTLEGMRRAHPNSVVEEQVKVHNEEQRRILNDLRKGKVITHTHMHTHVHPTFMPTVHLHEHYHQLLDEFHVGDHSLDQHGIDQGPASPDFRNLTDAEAQELDEKIAHFVDLGRQQRSQGMEPHNVAGVDEDNPSGGEMGHPGTATTTLPAPDADGELLDVTAKPV